MYKAIGKKIRDLRRLKGMTQGELSEKCEISLSFLGHIERGSRVLSVETLVKICIALNCSADHLLDIYTSRKINLSEVLRIAASRLEDHGIDEL